MLPFCWHMSRMHEQTKRVLILWFLFYNLWKIVPKKYTRHYFSVLLKTGFNPADINRFRSHTEKQFLQEISTSRRICLKHFGILEIGEKRENQLILVGWNNQDNEKNTNYFSYILVLVICRGWETYYLLNLKCVRKGGCRGVNTPFVMKFVRQTFPFFNCTRFYTPWKKTMHPTSLPKKVTKIKLKNCIYHETTYVYTTNRDKFFGGVNFFFFGRRKWASYSYSQENRILVLQYCNLFPEKHNRVGLAVTEILRFR